MPFIEMFYSNSEIESLLVFTLLVVVSLCFRLNVGARHLGNG